MPDFTIYHNKRCGKSRGALSLLREHGIEPVLRYYLDDAPSPEELKELLLRLGIKAEDLVRKNETLYKEKYQGKTFSEDQWIKILSDNPILIERPIVIGGEKAVIARPPEKALTLLRDSH